MPENPTESTTEKWQARFLAALGRRPNVTRAARAAGIDRTSAYSARARDPAFAQRWDAALELGVSALEDVAFDRARDGDVTLTIFLLKSHKPALYNPPKVYEHSGRSGGAIAIESRISTIEVVRDE